MRVSRASTVRDAPDAASAEFTSWVAPHWDHMLRLAQRLSGDQVAEDVVQEALAAAWRSRKRFDPERGQPRTWLLAIVANKAKDHRVHLGLVPDNAGIDDAPRRDSAVVLDIEAALTRLTDRQRSAVALYYYLGLSVSECGEVMGCAAGTVKSTLSDARARLGRILGEGYA